MIARIKYRKTLSGPLNYNQNKVNEGDAEILLTHRIEQPDEQITSVRNLIDEFNNLLSAGTKTKEPVIHISLNPHPEDRLDNYQYTQIAEEYMKRLGYGDQPYIVYKHNDIQREHLHIVSLRVDKDAKKIDDSFEYLRSKAITEQLEKEFNLHPAQSPTQKNSTIEPINIKSDDLKRQIADITNHLIKKYEFQSLGELRSLLSIYNIGLDEVKGETNGKPYHGLVYSALNENGEKVIEPISSSQFGKNLGYKNIAKRITKATEKIKSKKLKDKTKKVIDTTIKTAGSVQELKALLKEKNIDLLIRRNTEGRIYGVTFIDHNSHTVFNGSRLGKEYSANVFNEKFSSNQTEEVKQETPETLSAVTTDPTSHQNIDVDWGDFSFSLIDFKNLSLPFIDQSKEEDVSWLYKKKKRKRRRPGRQD